MGLRPLYIFLILAVGGFSLDVRIWSLYKLMDLDRFTIEKKCYIESEKMYVD